MATHRAGPDVIDTLGQRIDLLESLRERPMDKRTLEERLGVSRSTLDRAVRELETLGFVEYADGEYRITSCGRLAAAQYRQFERAVRVLDEFRPFVRHVDASEFDLDVHHLADAELFVPEPDDPYAMVDRHVRAIRTMDRGRGLLPFTGLHAQEAAHEAIVGNGATGQLVVEPGVADTLQTDPKYEELIAEMCEAGLELFVFDGEIPYCVGVFDGETVQLLADRDGEPRALLETTADEVRAWAERTFAEYKERATKLA